MLAMLTLKCLTLCVGLTLRSPMALRPPRPTSTTVYSNDSVDDSALVEEQAQDVVVLDDATWSSADKAGDGGRERPDDVKIDEDEQYAGDVVEIAESDTESPAPRRKRQRRGGRRRSSSQVQRQLETAISSGGHPRAAPPVGNMYRSATSATVSGVNAMSSESDARARNHVDAVDNSGDGIVRPQTWTEFFLSPLLWAASPASYNRRRGRSSQLPYMAFPAPPGVPAFGAVGLLPGAHAALLAASGREFTPEDYELLSRLDDSAGQPATEHDAAKIELKLSTMLVHPMPDLRRKASGGQVARDAGSTATAAADLVDLTVATGASYDVDSSQTVPASTHAEAVVDLVDDDDDVVEVAAWHSGFGSTSSLRNGHRSQPVDTSTPALAKAPLSHPAINTERYMAHPALVEIRAADTTVSSVAVTDSGPNEDCSICRDDMPAKSLVKTMPRCLHHFHPDCIDTWRECRGSCNLRAGKCVFQSCVPDDSRYLHCYVTRYTPIRCFYLGCSSYLHDVPYM